MKFHFLLTLFAIAATVIIAFSKNYNEEKGLPQTASIKKVKGGWMVTERNGRDVTINIYECWPICETPISK